MEYSYYHVNVALLHKAIRDLSVKDVEELLSKGVDVNAKASEGRTSLHVVPNSPCLDYESHLYCDEKIAVGILKLLLDAGADVHAKDNNGMTALQHALDLEHLHLVMTFIKAGGDVSTRNKRNQTALHFFTKAEDVKYLLSRGADINAKDDSGCLALMNELETGKLSDTCKIVLEHLAKLQMLELPVDQSFLEAVSRVTVYREYFGKCEDELKRAKLTEVGDSWVTFYNLLADDDSKLKNYAANEDLMQDFEKINCEEKFPIYGAAMTENVTKGIERRKVDDELSVLLSDCLSISNPTHLAVRNILGYLTTKDLSKLSK